MRMSVECKACGYVYGAWRSHCSACGEIAPASVRAELLASQNPQREEQRTRRARLVKHQCTLCRRSGAKMRCPLCDEEIHVECLRLHRADCQEFQQARETELKKLAPGVNALENPAALGRHITELMKGRL